MKIQSILLLSLPFVFYSCIEDNTTDATQPISEITIVESSMQTRYDIDKGNTLTISPQVTQTNEPKELFYTWEIDGETYSTEKELTYTGEILGSYRCRLIVSNEDGKAFYPFTLNVNSPYEEGITIISNDGNGKSHITFMLTNPDGTDSEHFTDYDCFERNNPGETMASNVSDMMQCGGRLIISCQGGSNAENDFPSIYYLNEKTFVMENLLVEREDPDFKPVKLQIPQMEHIGSYPIICENGKIYEFSAIEAALIKSTRMTSTYATSGALYDGGGSNYSQFFWDKEVGDLCMTAGWAERYAYYCSPNYLQRKEGCTGASNYFDGHEYVGMFMIRINPEDKNSDPQLGVITKNGTMYRKSFIYATFWRQATEGVNELSATTQVTGPGNILFNEHSPNVAYYNKDRDKYLLFASGNKIYRWLANGSQQLRNAAEFKEIGNGNDIVITSMEMNPDLNRTYVAYYDPNENGMNGHVTVFDTNTGDNLAQYDNICYRPVKIMYKKK